MITKITGRLTALSAERAILAIGPFEYEVLITDYSRRQLQNEKGNEISLHTIEYFDGNPLQGRMIPRLLGFLTEAEREFFDLFCSVDGVGSKKALRAMVKPVSEIAAAIEDQNVKILASLPGIGPATAERIVAKLRRKVPKFALLVDRGDDAEITAETLDIITETFETLQMLGHSEAEAHQLIDAATQNGKKQFKDTNSLIQTIYQSAKR